MKRFPRSPMSLHRAISKAGLAIELGGKTLFNAAYDHLSAKAELTEAEAQIFAGLCFVLKKEPELNEVKDELPEIPPEAKEEISQAQLVNRVGIVGMANIVLAGIGIRHGCAEIQLEGVLSA